MVRDEVKIENQVKWKILESLINHITRMTDSHFVKLQETKEL